MMLGVGSLIMGLTISAWGFDAQQVIDIARQTKDLDQTIEQVPDLIRLNPILFPGSRSAQYANRTFPRVILFDGGFRMAFGGGRHVRGLYGPHSDGDKIELNQFNPQRREYDFYEITFQDGAVHVEPNPESCKECHSRYLRPTWPTVIFAPQWAGAFGSTQSLRTDDWVIGREAQVFREFVAQNGDHPRYRALGLQRLVQEMSDDRLYAEFTRRNDRFERQLAEELPLFFVGHLEREGLLHQARVPLLRALGDLYETSPERMARADEFAKLHWNMTLARERLRDRVLGFDRGELPPEHTLPADSLLPLARVDEVFADLGHPELWTALTTARDPRDIEIPNGFSRVGLFAQLENALLQSGVEEHGLYDLAVDGPPEELLGAMEKADALAACENNLKK